MDLNSQTKKENGIIHIHSDNCDRCHKIIEIPIKKSDKESSIGGIFRIAVVHQCEKERIVLLFYFDDFLILRQKVSVPIAQSELKEGEHLDRTKLPDFKKFAGFKFLFKKIGDDLAKAIYAAIIGQQIAIVGDQTEVEPACLAISAFTEHRVCFIDEWTNEYSNADIVGTSSELQNLYLNAVIIDLERNTVRNGLKNDYCRNLIKKLDETLNKEQFESVLDKEINTILSLCQEFAIVRNIDEAEHYISALILEGNDTELLDIILPLTAQINSNIGIYYRKYLDLIQIDSLDLLEPINIWVFNDNFEKHNKIDFSQKDVPLNFREDYFISRLSQIAINKILGQELFEYVTPLHYFITLFSPKINLTFCFPRMSETEKQFSSSLKLCKMMFEEIETKDIFTIYLAEVIQEKLAEIIPKEKIILGDYEHYIELKHELAQTQNYFFLERHYIKSNIKLDNLRKFTESLTNQISMQFNPIDPKIIHQKSNFFITETIPGLQIFGTPKEETIDIGFNIHLLHDTKSKPTHVDIILEFFSNQIFFKYGIELNSLLIKLYLQFVDIIKKAILAI
ncbi:MAG: hypothetical protein ACFFDW_14400 [Candidatus Thorarchaeota archaeon]